MKRIFLAVTAIGFSLSSHAELQPIHEEHSYIAGDFAGRHLDALIEASMPDLAKYINKNDELRFQRVNHSQNLAQITDMESSAQSLHTALPLFGPGGLKIQIPGQVVRYGTINMNMGDFLNPGNFGKLSDFYK